jgi:soluble cytochrome b562
MRNLVQTLLNSKYVMSQEMVHNTELENTLLQAIDQKNTEVEKLRTIIAEKNKQISTLETELTDTKAEIDKFKAGVEELCLKPNQQFVWNEEGKLEIYDN